MQSEPSAWNEQFVVHADHAVATLTGCVSLEQAAQAVQRALDSARQRNIRRLLVDARQLTGFPSPTPADRYFIVRRWATKIGAHVEAALVLEQHILDPDRFGVVVAANLGMRTDAFSSVEEALEWLRSGRPAAVVAAARQLCHDKQPNQI